MLKRKKKFLGPNFEALIKRSSNFDNGDLLDSIDRSMVAFQRYLEEYHRGRDPIFLEELKLSAEAIYVLADVLANRAQPESTAGNRTRQVKIKHMRGSF
jgi:hypothetical protein